MKMVVILIAMLGAALCVGLLIVFTAKPVKTAAHAQELANFRRAWMTDCLQHAPAFQCIYMWSGVKPEEFVQ